MNKNECSDLGFLVTLYFINVVLYFVTFSWMVMLEKSNCECGENWKRNYIKYYIVIMFFIICAIALTFITNITTYSDDVFTYVKYAMLLAEIIFVVIVFLNMRDLIKKGCNCQKDKNAKIYDNIDIIICISSIAIALIFMLKRI